MIGGEARRAEDGNGTRSDSFGFAYDPSAKPAKLTQVFRGSPAWNGGLRVGDVLLKINDIEVTSENRAKYQDAMQNPIGGKLFITSITPVINSPKSLRSSKRATSRMT